MQRLVERAVLRAEGDDAMIVPYRDPLIKGSGLIILQCSYIKSDA